MSNRTYFIDTKKWLHLCNKHSNLHLSRSVVSAVLVLVRRPVSVPQKPFEAVFAFKLTDDFVERLAVKGVVVHRERRVADTGQEGRVRVLNIKIREENQPDTEQDTSTGVISVQRGLFIIYTSRIHVHVLIMYKSNVCESVGATVWTWEWLCGCESNCLNERATMWMWERFNMRATARMRERQRGCENICINLTVWTQCSH